jgi:hypothetical protein
MGLKFNVVQKSGIKNKKVTQKQKRPICIQYLKPDAFQISIPKWIEQFPSLFFHSYERVNLQLHHYVIFLHQ